MAENGVVPRVQLVCSLGLAHPRALLRLARRVPDPEALQFRDDVFRSLVVMCGRRRIVRVGDDPVVALLLRHPGLVAHMSQALYEVCLGYGNVHGNEPNVGRRLNRLGRCSAMTPWAESANLVT